MLRSWWSHLSRPYPSLVKAKGTCWVSTLPLRKDRLSDRWQWRDRQTAQKSPLSREWMLGSMSYTLPIILVFTGDPWTIPHFTSQIDFFKKPDLTGLHFYFESALFIYISGIQEVRRIHVSVYLWMVVLWIIPRFLIWIFQFLSHVNISWLCSSKLAKF